MHLDGKSVNISQQNLLNQYLISKVSWVFRGWVGCYRTSLACCPRHYEPEVDASESTDQTASCPHACPGPFLQKTWVPFGSGNSTGVKPLDREEFFAVWNSMLGQRSLLGKRAECFLLFFHKVEL